MKLFSRMQQDEEDAPLLGSSKPLRPYDSKKGAFKSDDDEDGADDASQASPWQKFRDFVLRKPVYKSRVVRFQDNQHPHNNDQVFSIFLF
jgi:hypothetical protein